MRILLAALLALPLPALAQTLPPVPVTTVTATVRNVDVYATGSGTVQAAQTALMRARVDGTIDHIAFAEGQDVTAGDVLVTIDQRPYIAALASARAQRDSDAARLTNAQLDYGRARGLANSPADSRQRTDTAGYLVAQLAANLRGDDAAVVTAGLNLSFCKITAPFSGVAGLRLVDEGNLVHAIDATGIVTITQIQPIAVIFTLPQNELPDIRTALQANIAQVLASGTDSTTTIATGSLLAASNKIDSDTGTISLKAMFPNIRRQLWPGQLVTARLRTKILANIVTIPTQTVQRGPDGLYVYALDATNIVVKHPITLAYEDDTTAAIASGVKAGEKIILSGQSRVAIGTVAEPHEVTATP